ncbi:MAG: hypothetical protein A3H98_09765 [Bacteroidetes bacterium RIFCSPLOWO2_02_FULL_36_8]|nr:MAG: hypothetical protein A3H98_09765 [Bacteroidetes bacterium RIFCSPLOWO2_02_FULL_36_8]
MKNFSCTILFFLVSISFAPLSFSGDTSRLSSRAPQTSDTKISSTKADSLKSLLARTDAPKGISGDTTRINLLNLLTAELINAGEYGQAMIYADEAVILCEKLFSTKNNLSAIININKATAYNNMGMIYSDKSDYDKALKFYLKALLVYEKLGNKNGVSDSYNNIANIHTYKSDYNKALEYYLKALSIYKEVDNKKGIAASYNNIGSIHAYKNEFNKTLECYFKALSINEILRDKNGMSNSYNNIANVHAYKGNLNKALKYYFKAMSMQEELGDKKGMTASCNNIGQINTELKRYKESRHWLNKCVLLSKENGMKAFLMNAYIGLSDLDSTLGNWNSAYTYHKLYTQVKDSIFNEESSKQITDMQTRYEADKKERENKLLRQKKNIRVLEEKQKTEKEREELEKIQRRNMLQYSGIGLTLFVLFIGIFLFARRFGKSMEHSKNLTYIKITEASLFISFLIFFEFILVLLDPNLEKFTGGEPLLKLFFNVLLAGVIFPLHNLLEKKLSPSLISTESKTGSFLFFIFLSLILASFSGDTTRSNRRTPQQGDIKIGSSKADSLKSLLARTDALNGISGDTARINLLNQLTSELTNTGNYEQALEYANEALILCDKLLSVKNNQSYIINNKKATVYNKIGIIHKYKGEYKMAIDFFFKSLTIYKELGDKQGISMSYQNIGVIHAERGNYEKGIEFFLKSLNIKEILNDKKGISNSYLSIGLILSDKGEYDKALKFYFKALSVKEELVDKRGIADSYNNIGNVYNHKSDYNIALEYHFKSLYINKGLGDKNGMAASYNNIGSIYKNKGDYDMALKFLYKALTIYEELGDKKGISSAYINIGIIYKSQNEYDKALTLYFKALSIFKELGAKRGIAMSYNNIGIIHKNKGDKSRQIGDSVKASHDYDMAMEFYGKSLSIREKLGDKKGMSETYSNIGNIYADKRDYDKAIEFYFKDLSISEELGNKNGMAGSYYNIGQINTEQKKYKESRQCLNKGLQFSKETGAKEVLMLVYEGLSHLDSTLSNWKSAYTYHKLYAQVKDNIFNEESNKQIADMQTRYETDKKEKENELLRHENHLFELKKKQVAEQKRANEEKIQKRNLLEYTGIAIGLFILGVSLGFFKRLKVPVKLIEVSVFIVFMIFFEFALVVLDPVLDKLSGGAPAWRLLMNSVIAGGIFYLHKFSERWLKKGSVVGM